MGLRDQSHSRSRGAGRQKTTGRDARVVARTGRRDLCVLRTSRFLLGPCGTGVRDQPTTNYFADSASRAGKFKLKRRTATKKLRAKFRALKHWFREHLTEPIAEVWATLNAKLRGHYQYYGVNDNWPHLVKYREAARRMTLRRIRRRSQAGRMSWSAYNAYLQRHPLVKPDRGLDCDGAWCLLGCAGDTC